MVNEPIAVLFVLASVVALAIVLELRVRPFKALGSALVGILFGMLLSNSGVLPGESPVYEFLGGPAVSAGIVLILLGVDVRSVAQAGPRMLAAFGVGAVGSAVGASLSAVLLADQIGPEAWKLAGQYTATYTGGGVNFAAVGATLDTSGDLFAAGIAADVTMTAIWMATCLTVPVLFASRDVRPGREASTGTAARTPTATRAKPVARDRSVERAGLPEGGADEDTGASLHRLLYSSVGDVGLLDLGLMAAIVLGTLWVSDVLGEALAPVPSILFLTTISLVLAQLGVVRGIRGTEVLGNYIVLVFLASNGAKSVLANIVAIGPAIAYFAFITVAVHGLIIFGLGRLVGLDLKTLAVASQANVGGPTSAMALATARGYTDRLLPGVAVGLLGYAVGNYLGLLVATAVHGLIG